MSPTQSARLAALFLSYAAPGFIGLPSDYVSQVVKFNEPDCSGPFSFTGRCYLREPIDCVNEPLVTDQTVVAGSRAGKTRIIFAQIAWILKYSPCRLLFVMPTTYGAAGAQNISRTRIQPMLRATPDLASMIPTGAARFYFKSLQMMLGGSIIDLTGSNSANNLASNPMRRVYQDEVDKFGSSRRRMADGSALEAHPCDLADERCKEFSTPFRFKSGTPTVPTAKLWDTLINQSDFRRRFIPCPHCSKLVMLAWTKQYTVIALTGKEAFVQWDSEAEAKRDMDRVRRSARFVCPHCAGDIKDEHKVKMDALGVWEPTRPAVKTHRGYHLPSMYSDMVETRVGNLAVKFLEDKKSPRGLQNFINSYLAEPYTYQDVGGERVEIISPPEIEIKAEWRKLMRADVQAKWPYFWYVIRAWNGGDSEGIVAGHCDSFDELAAIQKSNGVPDVSVTVDSGYDTNSVYEACSAHGEMIQGYILGWRPTKGAGKRTWRNDRKLEVPYFGKYIDPMGGTTRAGQGVLELFHFSDHYYEFILSALRDPKRGLGYRWAVSQQMDKATFGDGSTYWRHLDAHIFDGQSFKKRYKTVPDHLLDCEIGLVFQAHEGQIFDPEKPKQ